MKKTILTFGLISGALSSLMMVTTVPFAHRIGFDKALFVGYTTIVLSFLLVFFGIRSYRDNAGNGQITFAKAFAVGICITLISCIFYVVTWEIIYFNFMHDFMDQYGPHDRKAQGHRRECCSHSGTTSETGKTQRAVRKTVLQRSDDLHRALPGWPGDHADFRGSAEEKGAIATGTIAFASILNLFRPLRCSAVVDVHEQGADAAILTVFVSENTVKTHSSRVFDKLGAKRWTQAVQLGKEFGLLP